MTNLLQLISDVVSREGREAMASPLSCGHPPPFPGVEPGQVMLYMGTGVDIDCLTAANRVGLGPTGKVICLMTTQSLLNHARQVLRKEGLGNVECRLGELPSLPVEKQAVDWVISNRVIPLDSDRPEALGEILRVLKPGGRIAIAATLAHPHGATGTIWSTRFEGIKVYSASVRLEVSIEPAQEADLGAIQTLLRNENLPTDVAPHLDNFVVARHQEQVVGCSGMEVHGSEAVLRSLAVAPAYRLLGLSQRLLEARNDIARRRGIRRGYALTTTIAPLLEAWGYHRLDREEIPHTIRLTSEFRSEDCVTAEAFWREFSEPSH